MDSFGINTFFLSHLNTRYVYKLQPFYYLFYIFPQRSKNYFQQGIIIYFLGLKLNRQQHSFMLIIVRKNMNRFKYIVHNKNTQTNGHYSFGVPIMNMITDAKQ